jgi:carbonic anhydrase
MRGNPELLLTASRAPGGAKNENSAFAAFPLWLTLTGGGPDITIVDMREGYRRLLDGNRAWVDEMLGADPDYFENLAKGQSPEYLWIGCSDSRVPANTITRLRPGDVFVHRNIANLVVHTDLNMLSVLEYAVEVLKVNHVMVVGHYGCGGVKAAMSGRLHGVIDNWLRHIKDVYRLHSGELESIAEQDRRLRRLVELTVMEQVENLRRTSTIQNSWTRGERPHVHGMVYGVETGILKDVLDIPPPVRRAYIDGTSGEVLSGPVCMMPTSSGDEVGH